MQCKVADIMLADAVPYYGHYVLEPTNFFIGKWFIVSASPLWIIEGKSFDESKLFFYKIVGSRKGKLVAEEYSDRKTWETKNTSHFLDDAGEAVAHEPTGKYVNAEARTLAVELVDPSRLIMVFVKAKGAIRHLSESGKVNWKYHPCSKVKDL